MVTRAAGSWAIPTAATAKHANQARSSMSASVAMTRETPATIRPRPWIVVVNAAPTRRAFLGTVALTAAAAAPREAVMVVDPHAPCFAGPADERFPSPPAGPYRPAFAATPQDLLRAMDAAGVNAAVIVHPEPY